MGSQERRESLSYYGEIFAHGNEIWKHCIYPINSLFMLTLTFRNEGGKQSKWYKCSRCDEFVTGVGNVSNLVLLIK